jgi:hypothetical protein
LPEPAWGTRVAAVDENVAYAINGRHVLEYRDGSWHEVATLPDAGNAIWANAEVVIVAGEFQVFSWRVGSAPKFEALPEAPVGNYSAIWGFAADDVWLGNSSGQLVYYDGSSFSVLQVSREAPPAEMRGLWGRDGQLFFHTSNEFGRVVAKQVEYLLEPSEASSGSGSTFTLNGLWGLSPKEVFLTVHDPEFDDYACGGQFAVWFDGTEFHRF